MVKFEPPVGWRIDWDLVYDGVNDFERVYYIYQWQTWTEKKFLRKPVERVGWRVVYSTRYESSAVEWLKDTLAVQKLKG